MKDVIRYIINYIRSINIVVFITCSLLIATMIYLNFHYEIDPWIDKHSTAGSFFLRYTVFLIAFALPYLFYLIQGKNYFKNRLILFLVFLSPAIFSWKMVMPTELPLSTNASWNYYWNQIAYWPVRLTVMVFIL